MSETLELTVFSLVALVGLGLLTVNSWLRVPTWLDPDPSITDEKDPAQYGDVRLKANWKRLTVYSLIAGISFGLVAFILNSIYGWNQQSVVFASLGGYLLFQSIFTDFSVRRVDRWGQRIANVLSFGIGAYILAMFGNQFDWLVYLSFLAATLAIGLLPGVGSSDGRAFVFLVAAAYPVAGIVGLQWGAIFYLCAIIIYYLGMSVYHKEFRIKGLLTKFSFPIVPLIMAPALAVILFGRLLPGF